ncbi:MAG: hypothetical protein NMK33_00580 [Candidatus Cardinium sp.]|uniref:hypothetical protein n=1 Tax=Cardinium endosymbiont of Dermatophagoides farinae TaxID=2597823 RepID=UPI001183C726|nr:hypothetical protein [Cardinium endosymbiont of Dermatophagoides farinae]TSJ81022.1 hypothetical protein FPG78_03250 [Cardinium endosymbiont of Dermatophagoides farinae]UWW97051.1 MAG: hypothetical protein NMK33_00580 [Candidatus Cardinium sp.]
MLEHLKTRWKLTLCSSLFIHLIECSAYQIKMGMYQQRNTGGMPSHLVSTANLMPTGNEFDHIHGNSVLTKYTIHQGLCKFYKDFFKKIGAFYWKESNTNKEPESLINDINLALGLLVNNLDKSKLLINKDYIKFFYVKVMKCLMLQQALLVIFYIGNTPILLLCVN